MVSEHFLGRVWRFVFSFFLQEIFGQRVCRADLKILVKKFQKEISYLDSLWKNTQFQKKKNQSNWSPDEGVITDLKSVIFS